MNFRTFCIDKNIHYEEVLVEDSIINKFYEIINPMSIPIVAIPDGCIDIQFAYCNGKCTAYLAGSFLEGKVSVTGTYERCFGIKFNTGISLDCFLDSLPDIIDNRISIGQHVNWLKQLENALNSDSDLYEKIKVFLNFYSKSKIRKKHDITNYIISCVWDCNGCVKVSDVIERTGYAYRYVDRIFKTQTGISVKGFINIVRVQNAINALYSNKQNDIYAELGYYDQSHFIHEFKKYTTYTPSYIRCSQNIMIV